MDQDKDLSTPVTGSVGGSINAITRVLPGRVSAVRDWPRWVPYAAVLWSKVYAVLGLSWALSGNSAPGFGSNEAGPFAGRFGPVVAWIIVIGLGLPAAAVGYAMLRGVRRFRSVLVAAGILVGVILLLFMTDLILLITLAYIPFILFKLVVGADVGFFVQELTQSRWILIHQVLCLVGGFLWLAATVSYSRKSTDACLYCGRRYLVEGWTNPLQAARWGRIAVYVAMIAPVVYAFTRYAWALGIPLGMSAEQLRLGQESGMWVSGLFLATFGLVGAVLMLGLVQSWGEVFPHWMIGLAGRRVPIALAVVPASIASVLFMVGGTAILSGYIQKAELVAASGQNVWTVYGPTFLFPVWGASLAVATLAYYYRRRGRCEICGGGAAGIAR